MNNRLAIENKEVSKEEETNTIQRGVPMTSSAVSLFELS